VASDFLSSRCRGRAGHGHRHGARAGPIVVGDRDDNAGCGPCRPAAARDGDNDAGRGAASGPGIVRVSGGRLGAGRRRGRWRGGWAGLGDDIRRRGGSRR
jgi:hypothetical protein